MSNNKLQSAINEARDQLFLDTADGARLNVVSANLGVDRPQVGFDDDEWRAVVKQLALRPKLVRNIFHRLLEICVGPQKSRIGVLASANVIGDKIVTLADSSDLVQIGSLVFSPGQAQEETVAFCFRDLSTHRVFLLGGLLNVHNPVEYASSVLTATTSAGAASLVLADSKTLPTTGYPYSIIVDRGTPTEEALVVTNNDTVTNTLTLQFVTALDHSGPKSTFVRKTLQRLMNPGRVLVQLDGQGTRSFPATGWIRINTGAITEEVLAYEANDVDAAVLQLKLPVANAHVVGETVELVTPGSSVETCSVLQRSVDWELFETTPRKIKVFVPQVVEEFALQDVSFLHDAVPAAATTTLAVATATTDTVIELVSSAGFPETGIVLLNGSIKKFYTLKDDEAVPNPILTLTREVGQVLPIGTSVDLVLNPYPGSDLEEGNVRTSSGTLDQDQFTGPYVYDENQRAPNISARSTLDETIPPPTEVARDQLAGRTNLEVVDAVLYPAPPFDPFVVRVGRGSGAQEDRTVTDVTLRRNTTTVVDALTLAGSVTLPGTDTTGFPESDGVNPAGYQIVVDRGGANEEFLEVAQNITGLPGTFSLVSPTAINHVAAETIELVHDVLTLGTLAFNHKAGDVSPTTPGHWVEVLVDSLTVVNSAPFPSAGRVLINFGKERINVRSKITTVVSPTILEFANSSLYPTTNFPYRVKVGDGRANAEDSFVIANDIGLNRLTLQDPLVGTFSPGDYVSFDSGAPRDLEYTSKSGFELRLPLPVVLDSVHTNGESVILSPTFSVPSTLGSDYAFLLPPTSEACLSVLFELARAAGVEIVFVEDR